MIAAVGHVVDEEVPPVSRVFHLDIPAIFLPGGLLALGEDAHGGGKHGFGGVLAGVARLHGGRPEVHHDGRHLICGSRAGAGFRASAHGTDDHPGGKLGIRGSAGRMGRTIGSETSFVGTRDAGFDAPPPYISVP